jgi:UDP-2-acetamido-3-amino-2,3-dideoxy-glucuronate N-acetyltransferase
MDHGGELVTIKRNKKETSRDIFIHPTAIVDMPCEIGNGTKIWHHSHIMKEATIGEKCIIGQNVYIGSKYLLATT